MRKFAIFVVVAGAVACLAAACSSRGSKKSSPSAIDSTATTVVHPEWAENSVIYEVNLRQYTPEGTLAAFSRHLPRLKQLGADILWFMPVHPISKDGRKGGLGSYYAVADYKALNPEFGTLDEFRTLVRKAHDMGFKVIIDWVPNHTGRDNIWVSEHPDRYVRDSSGNFVSPYDWTDVYKLDYTNPSTRKGMIDAMAFWLREADIDGFRCDVAGEVPTDFWNEARKSLEAVKPELFMLAEASKPELQKDAFDMGYNWPMKDLFNAIAATAGQNNYVSSDSTKVEYPVKRAIDIDTLLARQSIEYPAGTYMMNMITNHDLNSWEGTEFERLGNLTDAMAVLMYTLPGMPLIYTGQETGLDRALLFFDKDDAPQWTPRNGHFDFYQKLNHLKHTHPSLRAGSAGAPMKRYPTESDDVYAFSRSDEDGATVYVFVNLGSKAAPVRYTGNAPKADATAVNFFTGRMEAFPDSLESGEYRIYVSR
ncbi:alpha-amylase family glycosyl hydrolase [uncultured Muribaculum sp.]|uniref:alpha-amylase family glycosyl hydrolase n=1 Tax=uncultured Muribaculum sp. TaxID=1918613 RepID=UPI0025E39F4A|nr:alpha-amylase family glycosyl hydrolase [uncultured Muribaculum sp.]